jgi:hypothetical protein
VAPFGKRQPCVLKPHALWLALRIIDWVLTPQAYASFRRCASPGRATPLGDDGDPRYVLVCGEVRLNAFRILGETHIPALVVDVSDEDAFIMSLA